MNLALIFAVGFAFTWFASEIVALQRAHRGSPVLFAINRTVLFALVSLVVTTIPLLFARRGRKKFTAGPIVVVWLLFLVLNVYAFVSEQLP